MMNIQTISDGLMRKNLGVLATKTKDVTTAISRIKENYEEFEENLGDFQKILFLMEQKIQQKLQQKF